MTVSPSTVGTARWRELDGLRGIAILLVLARHSLRPFISEDAYRAVVTVGSVDLTPLLLNGWVGVDLFFVLSGFLIGRQALRGRDTLPRFWFRRALRILPAYWTCLGVIGLWLTLSSAWSGRAGDFVAHLAMLQDYTGSVFNPAFWSLGAEEKFYLLAPLLALLLGVVSRRWAPMLILTLWAMPVALRASAVDHIQWPISYDQYFPLYRSPFHLTCESLVLGFGVAWVTLDRGLVRPLDQRWLRELLFWGGAGSVLCWMARVPILVHISAQTVVWAPSLIGIGFAMMVLACVSGEGSYSVVLGGSGWLALSTGSYTLYLTHMGITPLAIALSVQMMETSGVTTAWLMFLPFYVALSTGTAVLLHRYIEQPMIVWRDRILQRQVSPTQLHGLSLQPRSM